MKFIGQFLYQTGTHEFIQLKLEAFVKVIHMRKVGQLEDRMGQDEDWIREVFWHLEVYRVCSGF
jgi:hypothetical protein